jgi:integrase
VSGKRAHLEAGPDSRQRTKDFTWKRAARHLEQLKLRHRRVHDLRRTFVSLATAAGADDRILHWGTHGRPGDIMGAYNDSDWKRLCAEWTKLELTRRARAGAVVQPMAPRMVPDHGATGVAAETRRGARSSKSPI